jgi:acyl carrier protein
LIKHIAGIVGMAPAKLAVDQPLTELGMDSLMLVELQIGLERQFGIAIPTLKLMALATVAKLGRRIIETIGIDPTGECSAAATYSDSASDSKPEALAEPALELSLGRLLEQKLDRVKERPI